ncbi:GNAT family N-acetyltransferase [Pseudoclavibacter helvolus]|uniref:GNAT family N-acetyltransferase n=1 Tax=Pseudoclavibacter helvolus TaxID=255205 RepID=UPI003C77B723
MTLQRIQQPDLGGRAPGVKKDLQGGLFHRPRFLRGPRTEQAFDAPELFTERLRLRPHTIRDAEAWHEIVSDPEVIRYLHWKQRDLVEATEHLSRRTTHTRLWQSGDFMALAVEHRGALIGDVSVHLREVEADRRSAELGWIMHPGCSGHGFATEAADALVEYLRDYVGVKRVLAVMDLENEASYALARRLGFTEVSRSDESRTTALDLV